MNYCKKFVSIVLAMILVIASLSFPAHAASLPVAVDFDIVVGSDGTISIKGLSNTTFSEDAETNPHKTYTLTEAGIVFNNNAAVLNDAPTYTKVAVPSWSTQYGPTIKLGQYQHSYYIIERSITNSDVFKISTTFKKLDTAHNFSVFQEGGSGVEFSVAGNKIKLGNKDTGLTWTVGHWYKLDLYFNRTSAAVNDGVVVMYLTDMDAVGGPVTYRREASDSWTSDKNEFRTATGRSWSTPGTDIEWAYWYADDAVGEVFTSTNSFDANYIAGDYYTTDGFTQSDAWTLSSGETGHFKFPKAFPTSGEVTLDIYDKGTSERSLCFNAYDEETSEWILPQELIKMNSDSSISVYQLSGSEGEWTKEFVAIPTATWVPAKDYKTSLRIDLDSPAVYSIGGTDTSFYPAAITITDIETGTSNSANVNIPLDVAAIDGINVTTVGDEEKVYDFTAIDETDLQNLIDSGEIAIQNEVNTADKYWSIDNTGLTIGVKKKANLYNGNYANLFQWDGSGDYTAIACVDATTGASNTGSGMWETETGFAIHADNNNYLTFGVGSRYGGYIVYNSKNDGEVGFSGNGTILKASVIGSSAADKGNVWLKIEKTGDVYNCYYSLDGAVYTKVIEDYTFADDSAQIGIYSGSNSDTNSIEGLFKSLTISKTENVALPGGANYSVNRIVMNHEDDTHMVVASKPFNTKKDVQLDVIPELTFDIAPYDVNDYSYTLSYSDETNDNIPVTVSPELTDNTVKLIPDGNLEQGKVYTITVGKGDITVFTSQFTTIADEIVYKQITTTAGDKLTTRQFVKMKTSAQPIMVAGTYDSDGILINRDADKPEEAAYADLTTTIDTTGSATTDVIAIESAESLKPLVVTPAPTTITNATFTDAYFDRSVPGKLVVKGKLTGAPENTEVFVLVTPDDGNDSTTDAEERALYLTDAGISGATYYKKILTNAGGEFEFSAQTGAGIGDYKIAFGYNGCSSAVESPIIKCFDQSTIDEAISTVNMATTATDMFTALDTYKDVLDIGTYLDELDDFDGIDDNSVHQDMKMRLSKYIIDKRPNDVISSAGVYVSGGYTQIIDVTNDVKKIVPLCKFDYAHDNADIASKKAILCDSDDKLALGIGTLEAMTVFDALSDAGKTRVAEKLTANDNNDFELFKKMFVQETLLSAIQNALLHSDLTSTFEKCNNSMASALVGIDYATYYALDDKSSVNIGIVSRDFSDISALATVMNPLISKANSPSYPPSGSGGAGGSDGSFKPVIEKPPVTVEPAYEFRDMKGYDWAQEAVTELAKQKIIAGKADGVFDPGGSVLREEFTKMIVLLFNLSGSNNLDFKDVSEDDWFYEYVEAAFANEIVNGTSEQFFGTGDKILRQDMAVMIHRAAVKAGIIDEKSADSTNLFSDDSEIDEYAKKAVYTLGELGVINGTGNGMFNPKGTATRAEAAKIIYEILKLKNA